MISTVGIRQVPGGVAVVVGYMRYVAERNERWILRGLLN
jgi:hypothetical protein